MVTPVPPPGGSPPPAPGQPPVPANDAAGPIVAVPSTLYLELSTGTRVIFHLTPVQQGELRELCQRFAGGDDYEVDITNEAIAKDGQTTPLTPEQSQQLRALIGKFFTTDPKKPYHPWTRNYPSSSSRAFKEAPASFDWKFEYPLSPELDFEGIFKKREITEKAERMELLKRHRVGQLFAEQVEKDLREIARDLRESMKGKPPEEQVRLQSRLRSFAAVQEKGINRFAIAFEMTHPLPEDAPVEKLREKAEQAQELLTKQQKPETWTGKVGKWVREKIRDPQDTKEPAKELALAGLTSRKAYLDGCALLETAPHNSTIEHFIMRSIEQGILDEGLFEEVFEQLHQEDREELAKRLTPVMATLKEAYRSCPELEGDPSTKALEAHVVQYIHLPQLQPAPEPVRVPEPGPQPMDEDLGNPSEPPGIELVERPNPAPKPAKDDKHPPVRPGDKGIGLGDPDDVD